MRDRRLSGYLVPHVPWAEAADGPVSVVLDGDEGRHAATVRRVRIGEQLMISDGEGHWAHAEVVAVSGRDQVELLLTGGGFEPPSHPRVTVVQALPKGDRGPLAVELLTEVGVDTIVPWQAARCVTRWTGDKATKGHQRWQRVAHEATKQSRRVWQPEVTPMVGTGEVEDMCRQAEVALVCHEVATEPLVEVLRARPAKQDVLVVVGPEGGLTDEEVDRLAATGAHLVGMGPVVMRTSTAGAVAAAVVMSHTGRWQ